MCVALGIQKRICCIILSSVACPAVPHFSTYLINGLIFGKKLLNTKCVLGFPIQFSPETLLSLRIIERDININVHKSSCEVPFINVRFQKTWILLTIDFWKILIYKISWKSIQWEQVVSHRRIDRHDKGNSHSSRFCKHT